MWGKQRWAVLHDNDNEVIWADSARTSQQCYHMKRPVCAACPVFPLMLRPLLLLSVLWGPYGQVISMEGRVLHQPKAQQQLDWVDQNHGFIDIKTDAGKQEGQSHEQQTCPICKWMSCFKCQVLIWAGSKLLRRHVRLCKTKHWWFSSSW